MLFVCLDRSFVADSMCAQLIDACCLGVSDLFVLTGRFLVLAQQY